MNTIYILIIILITLVTNASLSFAMPFMKTKWKALIKRYFTRIKRQPPIDCTLLASRVAILEKKLIKRESNYRQAIRQEITNILIELKNK